MGGTIYEVLFMVRFFFILFYFILFYLLFYFLGLQVQHVEVPGLGVELELPAYNNSHRNAGSELCL